MSKGGTIVNRPTKGALNKCDELDGIVIIVGLAKVGKPGIDQTVQQTCCKLSEIYSYFHVPQAISILQVYLWHE